MVADFSVQLTSYNIELLCLNLLLISEHKERGDCLLNFKSRLPACFTVP